MSYEKKKLAGVGNTHLYQYQTPGLMEQDHPDVYPMRMNPMQQYPCPMQPPPQQTHTMNPADQCLSTPQPPSQTSDMVDNGSCMAAVSRVVMEDPMQEPTDNLGLDDAYRTGETAVQQPTLEMPIRAEVVMEPDPNEDEAEPDGEDDVEKSRISSKKHCFVCNTQLPEDIETAVPFFKTETTKTNKKFSAVITKLVGRSITPRKAHSEIICRRCFNLLDRIDTLEVELRDSKDEVISMYKTTLDIYGGKTRRKRTVVSRKSPFLYSKNTKVGRTSAVKSPKIEKQETIEAQVPTTTQTVENVVDTGVPTTSYEQSCSSMPKGLEMDDDIDDMEDLDDSKKTEEEGSKDTAQKKRNRKFKAGLLTSNQRASILSLKGMGWSMCKVAKNLNLNYTTVKKVFRDQDEEFETDEDSFDLLSKSHKKTKRGRPSSTSISKSDEEIDEMISNSMKSEFDFDLQTTIQTICTRMKEIKDVAECKDPAIRDIKRRREPRKPKVQQITKEKKSIAVPSNPLTQPHHQIPLQQQLQQPQQSQQIHHLPQQSHMANNPVPCSSNANQIPKANTQIPDIYKELKDITSGYRVNNEAYFQRTNKPVPYYNDPSIIFPQMYQQFYQHPPHHQ